MDNMNLKYVPLQTIAATFGLNPQSLKIRLSLASKRGIELPARRRCGRIFLYDSEKFSEWLWEHSEKTKQSVESLEKLTVESNKKAATGATGTASKVK
jgi:hypothetical protein